MENNCRYFEGYGIMVPEAMVNTLLEKTTSLQSEIDILKEENLRLQKALDGARQSINDMKNPLKRRKF